MKDKRKYMLWILLTIMSIGLYQVEIDYFFNSRLSLTMILFILIVKLFPIYISIPTCIGVYLLGIVLFHDPIVHSIVAIQIIFLAFMHSKFYKRNVVILDIVFWGVFGLWIMPLIFKMNFPYLYQTEAKFYTYLLAVNHLATLLIGDIIATYLPWDDWMENRNTMNWHIKFRNLLLHLFISIVLLAFALNMHSSIKNSHRAIATNIELMGQDIQRTLNREIDELSDVDVIKLSLFGSIQLNKFEQLLEQLGKDQIYQYALVNHRDQVLITNVDTLKTKDLLVWHENQMQEIMSQELNYRIFQYEIKRRMFYVYEGGLGRDVGKIIIKIPQSHYTLPLLEDYSNQFKLLGMICLFIVFMSLLIDKLVFKPLEALEHITQDMPQKLMSEEQIKWPRTIIDEIHILNLNFQNTASNLKEMFTKTNALNKELSMKSEKLRLSKEKLHQLAYYDPLTQIGNRLSFKKYTKKIKEGSFVEESKIAMIFMDMDHFKQINDTLGHDVGDELLKQVSRRLEGIKKIGIEVFRLGGDEFVVTIKTMDLKIIHRISNLLVHLFAEPFKIGEASLNVTGSFGLSIYPIDSNDIDMVVKYADMAMYQCKRNGGGYIQNFDSTIKELFLEQVVVEKEMREAFKNKEFRIHYQPKVNFKKKQITSMEALIRWKHKELGWVSPAKFIPIAEESGFIPEIDRWVLREVCRQNKIWQDLGYSKIPISINISAKHFTQSYFLKLVQDIIEDTGISPKYIIIEITESAALENVEHAISVIEKLRILGVKVSIDDFGRGYSSLNQLLVLPVNEIKIDQEFIRDVKKDYKKECVVKSLINLAHQLSLNVVAEGIENQEELNYLLEMDCDEIQGFFISKPLSADQLVKLLRKTKGKIS